MLATLALPEEVLTDLSEIDSATNERKIAEQGRSPDIGTAELLYGVPHAPIVNAAFTHAGAHGHRFSGRTRGAWYAGMEIETSIAEVRYHKQRFLKETRAEGQFTFEYADYTAEFSDDFHFLDGDEQRACLQPEPIPQCYDPSQAMAGRLLHAGSNGIVYPSVRRQGGTCIACFRPALVSHPRKGEQRTVMVVCATRGEKK